MAGIALAAAGALALNQYLERHLDARMERTRSRPLPDGRLLPAEALAFGAACAVAGPLLLALLVNQLAAAVTAATVAIYLFVYTPMKRRTSLATLAGAVPGAIKTASGLIYRTTTPGTGRSPKATDRVSVHYHGTLPDGKVFDSSVQRGQPAEFKLNEVIPCWTEGVQRMKVGEKARLVCPPELAYGDRGAGPDIGPGATLVFDVELIAIK